jgi:hypothetical protein
MKGAHIAIGLGVGALGLVTFLLFRGLESPRSRDAAASPSSPPEVPAARAGSASERLVDRSSLAPTANEKDPNEELGTDSVSREMAEGSSEGPSAAFVRVSAREEVLKVLDQAEGHFRDPEIRRAFSRERNKIMANFSE